MNHNCGNCSFERRFLNEVILAYCDKSTTEDIVTPPEPGPEIPPKPIECIATYHTFNEYDARLWKEPRDYFLKSSDFYGRLFEDRYSGSQVDETYFMNEAISYAKAHSIIYGLPQPTRPIETSIGIEIEGNFIFADYNSFSGRRTNLEDVLANSIGTREVNSPGLPTYPEGTDVTRYFMYYWGYLEQLNAITGFYEPMNNGELMIVGSTYLDVIPLNQLEV